MSISKKCEVCSNDFEAKNNKAKYCSNSCRVKAYREREKQSTKKVADSVFVNIETENEILQDKIMEIEHNLTILKREFKLMLPYVIEMATISKKYSYIEKNVDLNSESINNLKEKTEDVLEKLTLKAGNNQDAVRQLAMEIELLKTRKSGGSDFNNALGQLLQDEKFLNSISNAISAIARKKEPKKEEAK